MRAEAARRLNCGAAEVALADGRATAPDGKSVSWAELAPEPMSVEGAFSNHKHTWAYGAHAAHVAVDPKTGAVALIDYVAVENCGRMINPLTLKGQLVGAVVQGLGGAFLEHLVYDENGQLLTGSLADYLMPTASDFPKIRGYVMESHPSPINPLGAKGAGEGGIISVGGVIANAVADALASFGVEPRDLPLSPSAGVAAGAGRAQVIPSPSRGMTSSCASNRFKLNPHDQEQAMAVARHPRPKELEGVPLEDIMKKYVGRFKDKKPDWAAFEDAKIEGYKRAQHRFIGAGGSGKHGDPNIIPAGNFTLSIMYVNPGQGNAAHTHEVEECFFVLQGFLDVFVEDESGKRLTTRLGPWECIACPAGVIHGYQNEFAGAGLLADHARPRQARYHGLCRQRAVQAPGCAPESGVADFRPGSPETWSKSRACVARRSR